MATNTGRPDPSTRLPRMQTFKHRDGTVITLDHSAVFHAERNGVKYEAGSLAGMAKKLDAKPAVEPFDAIDYAYGAQENCRVVGIAKKSGRRKAWTDDHWLLANGNERRSVYADTPESRALIHNQRAMLKRHEAVRKEHEKELAGIAEQLDAFKRTPPKRT